MKKEEISNIELKIFVSLNKLFTGGKIDLIDQNNKS